LVRQQEEFEQLQDEQAAEEQDAVHKSSGEAEFHKETQRIRKRFNDLQAQLARTHQRELRARDREQSDPEASTPPVSPPEKTE
jgi:50S ribosomal subunit-associated GTPase HflX